MVVLIALLASIRGISNDYALDDLPLVVEDTRVHAGFSVARAFRSPYWPDDEELAGELYRPLATTLIAVQWGAGGGAPWIFRVVSSLLSAAVTAGFLTVAARLLPGAAPLAAASLFAAHPVHVEAVALGVNQGELWVALIALAILARYLDARRDGYPSAQVWTLIGALLLVACFFKEHAVVIPGLLIAAEATLLRDRSLDERLRRLWPGFAALVAVCGFFVLARALVLGGVAGTVPADALLGQGPLGRTLTMLQVVPEWLRLLAWPARLSGDYSPAVISQAEDWGAPQIVGIVLLAAVAAVAWTSRRQAPIVTFGIAWMAIALLPVSNVLIPTGVVLAERTLYLASAGIVLALVGLAAALAPELPPVARRLLYGSASLLVVLGVARSAMRQEDWRNHYRFWEVTAQDVPTSYRAHHALAKLHYERGAIAAAIDSYRRAVALAPSSQIQVRTELGDLLRTQGDCAGALEVYDEILRLDPSRTGVRLSSVTCLLQMGRLDEARTRAAGIGGR